MSNLKYVESSNIAAIDYEDSIDRLRVYFHSGYAYDYFGVPKNIVNGLMTASSVGRYFHQNIRNKYDYQQVNVKLPSST
jgi:hypothetical protein